MESKAMVYLGNGMVVGEAGLIDALEQFPHVVALERN